MRRLAITAFVGFGIAASLTSVHAGEALPRDVARRLDKQAAEFTMSEAKRERLMIIQENMGRQRYYERRHGYGGGYGYGRRYGGPPPWAPAYGYRRDYDDRW
ncbi:hypothetical protein [Bosea sp. TAF32]|uniref:hypothetical protein n=1 Tax=Bosea sp. TAF32 TaxID=3237482 RepID=UPI003F93940A